MFTVEYDINTWEGRAVYTAPGVPGELVIFEPDDNGCPEVDYNSGIRARCGSVSALYAAIRLARDAMADYRRHYGFDGLFTAAPEGRDGCASIRRRIFRRYFPDLALEADWTGA